MLKRNGFMPAVSVGAFVDKTLVAFILNGVREWDNEKTVYDLGTGVIPDFRRTGIMGELLNLVSAIWMNEEKRIPIKKVRCFTPSITKPLNISPSPFCQKNNTP